MTLYDLFESNLFIISMDTILEIDWQCEYETVTDTNEIYKIAKEHGKRFDVVSVDFAAGARPEIRVIARNDFFFDGDMYDKDLYLANEYEELKNLQDRIVEKMDKIDAILKNEDVEIDGIGEKYNELMLASGSISNALDNLYFYNDNDKI